MTMKRNVKVDSAGVIAINTALSAAVDLGTGLLATLKMPAAWTSAPLSFDGSQDDGVTYKPIYDGPTERTFSAADMATMAGMTVSLDPNDWRGFTHIKFRSGINGATVNQGAARTFTCGLERGV